MPDKAMIQGAQEAPFTYVTIQHGVVRAGKLLELLRDLRQI